MRSATLDLALRARRPARKRRAWRAARAAL